MCSFIVFHKDAQFILVTAETGADCFSLKLQISDILPQVLLYNRSFSCLNLQRLYIFAVFSDWEGRAAEASLGAS